MARKKLPYCPIFIDLEGRDVLLVGGGNVCARKAGTFLQYGARVTVVSPVVTTEIERWVAAGKVALHRKTYDDSDLVGRSLVIASTDDRCVNARVARDCRRRGIAVNVADAPHLSGFILPAVIDRGSIQIAISTGGNSPALARRLRDAVDGTVGDEYVKLNEWIGALRPIAKKTLTTDADRKSFYEGILSSGILELLRDGSLGEACRLLATHCSSAGIPLPEEIAARCNQP